MPNTFRLQYILLFSMIFSVTACADSPRSPISGTIGHHKQDINNNGSHENSIIALAVKYEGKDTQGRKCDFYATLSKESEGHNSTHAHPILMKVDFTTLDGHRPHAGEAQFYLYDRNSGTYYDQHSNQPNTILSLLSLNLRDSDEMPNVNQINDYLAHSELEQYLRVEFAQGANGKLFEKTLDAVLKGNSSINDNLNIFDRIQLITMATAHGDHYHFPTCLNYQPVSVEETEFDLRGHDHDDSDHGHSHGHE